MEEEKSTIILMMRDTPERTKIRQILNQFAEIVTLFKKDDVLKFLKMNFSDKHRIAALIGDFSDIEIDAWGVLEPLFVVMKGVPVYVIAAKGDASYQEMMTEGIAGVFTRPFSMETLGATIEMELMMRTSQETSNNLQKKGEII